MTEIKGIAGNKKECALQIGNIYRICIAKIKKSIYTLFTPPTEIPNACLILEKKACASVI